MRSHWHQACRLMKWRTRRILLRPAGLMLEPVFALCRTEKRLCWAWEIVSPNSTVAGKLPGLIAIWILTTRQVKSGQPTGRTVPCRCLHCLHGLPYPLGISNDVPTQGRSDITYLSNNLVSI